MLEEVRACIQQLQEAIALLHEEQAETEREYEQYQKEEEEEERLMCWGVGHAMQSSDTSKC